MNSKIHVLSDETINQIAAGEVIESPGSVVKELIENSLDAGAKKIVVEISGGGLKLIRITDDGSGMSEEDAKACIVRHATSKISKATDLFHIATKGFRGEALSSIASIGKMTLQTAMENATGIELEIEKGKVIQQRPCARIPGTTIEVRSLFYNVPARKKFQKTGPAISAEIFRVVSTLALSHPDVQFELISNKRKAIKTLAKDFYGRAEELLGKEFTGGSRILEFKEGPLHFSGLIGSPLNHRPNRLGQFLFLNRRSVISEPIYEAVRLGYGTRLESRRHPVFLLYLEVPFDLIDVNVHPQKLEVRLRSEDLFREKVSFAVSSALNQKKETSSSQVSFTPTEVQFEDVPFRLQEEVEEIEIPYEESFRESLGQVGNFLLFHDQKSGEVIFLDAKAASFRLLFENLRQKQKQKSESQGLLVPFSIYLTTVESAMVLTHLEAIEKMGFSLRPMGKDAFMVEAIPPFLEESAVQHVITEMAQVLQEFIGKRDYQEEREEKLALLTARYAKRKTIYLPHEAQLLLSQLLQCDAFSHCPTGNPTMVKLTYEHIENLFRESQKTAKSS